MRATGRIVLNEQLYDLVSYKVQLIRENILNLNFAGMRNCYSQRYSMAVPAACHYL